MSKIEERMQSMKELRSLIDAFNMTLDATVKKSRVYGEHLVNWNNLWQANMSSDDTIMQVRSFCTGLTTLKEKFTSVAKNPIFGNLKAEADRLWKLFV